MEKPRTWERDCQTGSDTLDRSPEGSGVVLFEVFLADELQQRVCECAGRAWEGIQADLHGGDSGWCC